MWGLFPSKKKTQAAVKKMAAEEGVSNALELEHIIGFSGSYLRSATFHPKNSKFVVYAMGSMIVIEDTTDPFV